MIYETNSLQHFGIKGQKWGLRRFQEEDGTLTEVGKARYGVSSGDGKISGVASKAASGKAKKEKSTDEKKQKRKDMIKKAAVGIGAAALVGASAVAASKAYKKSTGLRDELRGKARENSNEARWNRSIAASRARTAIDNSKLARYDQRRGLNDKGRNSMVSAMNQRQAHDYFTLAKKALELEKKYDKIAMNATRRDAVRNYIKNKGRIVLD